MGTPVLGAVDDVMPGVVEIEVGLVEAPAVVKLPVTQALVRLIALFLNWHFGSRNHRH